MSIRGERDREPRAQRQRGRERRGGEGKGDPQRQKKREGKRGAVKPERNTHTQEEAVRQRSTERQRPGEKQRARKRGRKQDEEQQGQREQSFSGTPERQTDSKGWRKRVGGRKERADRWTDGGVITGPETW